MTMPLRSLTLALLTSSTLILTDCRKTAEEPAPKVSEREKFLTASSWFTDAVTEERITSAGVVTTTDIPLSSFDPCSLDDTYYYRPDRTYNVDEGALTCPQRLITAGTWEFASNETELVVKMAATTSRSPIRTLTSTTLSYVIIHDTLSDGTQISLIQHCVAR